MPGEHPTDGDGNLVVTLTKNSAEALAKVESLAGWKVLPTMTRGSGCSAAAASLLPQAAPKSKSATTSNNTGKRAADKDNKKIKKPKLAVLKPEKPEKELTEDSIRRTKEGREAIQSILKEIKVLDENLHARAPTFTSTGQLRMKFEGANQFTWEMLLDGSGKTFESLHFGVCVRQFLYATCRFCRRPPWPLKFLVTCWIEVPACCVRQGIRQSCMEAFAQHQIQDGEGRSWPQALSQIVEGYCRLYRLPEWCCEWGSRRSWVRLFMVHLSNMDGSV